MPGIRRETKYIPGQWEQGGWFEESERGVLARLVRVGGRDFAGERDFAEDWAFSFCAVNAAFRYNNIRKVAIRVDTPWTFSFCAVDAAFKYNDIHKAVTHVDAPILEFLRIAEDVIGLVRFVSAVALLGCLVEFAYALLSV